MIKHRKICVFLILYFHIAVSIHHFKIDAPQNQVLSKSMRSVEEKADIQHNDDIYSKLKSKSTSNLNPLFGKSILVSRILPHGYQAQISKFEKIPNIRYKPLIRIHVRKPIGNNLKDTLHQQKSRALGYVVVINKNDEVNKIQITDNVKKDNESTIEEANWNNNFNIKNLNIVRTLNDGSDEDFDESQSGLPHQNNSKNATEPSVVVEPYPFWNYWTYQKTIHQDDCEGNLIKLGDMCIAPEGHRRLID